MASLEGVLANIPGLAGYLGQQQESEGQLTRQLGQAGSMIQLQNAIRAQQQDQALKATLAQSGGDLEQALPALIKSGHIKDAHELAPLIKLQQEKAQREQTVQGLKEIYSQPTPSQDPEAPQASPTDARRQQLQKVSLLYAGNPALQTAIQREIDKLDKTNESITAKVVQDKTSPTGWSHADVRTGRILMTGAPPPASQVAKETADLTSPDAIKQAASRYRIDGTMPSLGWGNSGAIVRARVLNEAARQAAEEGSSGESERIRNIATASSKVALNAVSKDLAAIGPFHDMLNTNAKIAIDLAKKISSTRTGSQFANRPLTWLQTNASDNPDIAEYLFQMQTVKTEGARILNNPRLVGQLTDSARMEMGNVVNGNMPLGQTERVLKRMMSDGDNRVNALKHQREALIAGMYTKPEEPAPMASPSNPVQPKASGGWRDVTPQDLK